LGFFFSPFYTLSLFLKSPLELDKKVLDCLNTWCFCHLQKAQHWQELASQTISELEKSLLITKA
ncbi:S-protein 18, partial [Clarias magur]